MYHSKITGWWFGTWLLFFHLLGRIIPTDYYVSEGLKPPTSKMYHSISFNNRREPRM
jgi:hypothetical protein